MFKIIVEVIKQLTGDEPFDKLRYGVANTALIKHNGKILALEETCLPFEIKVVDSEDGPFHLESVGYEDFGGTLKHQVSAHPKLDAKTGELITFGYNVAK
jgi:carotenoid cleavage dioxygenase